MPNPHATSTTSSGLQPCRLGINTTARISTTVRIAKDDRDQTLVLSTRIVTIGKGTVHVGLGIRACFNIRGATPGGAAPSNRGSSNLAVHLKNKESERKCNGPNDYINADLLGCDEEMDVASDLEHERNSFQQARSPAKQCHHGIHNGAKGFTGVVDAWAVCEPKVKHRDGH